MNEKKASLYIKHSLHFQTLMSITCFYEYNFRIGYALFLFDPFSRTVKIFYLFVFRNLNL